MSHITYLGMRHCLYHSLDIKMRRGEEVPFTAPNLVDALSLSPSFSLLLFDLISKVERRG